MTIFIYQAEVIIEKRRGDDADVFFLHDMLQSEYVGLYGEPDPNPEGGLDRSQAIFVLYQTGRPVGLVAWKISSEDGCSAVLQRMYVHYAFRGRGYSSMLLEAAEKSAREAGAEAMILETGTVQTAAIALYSSRGYSAVKPFGFYADQVTSVFLGKDL